MNQKNLKSLTFSKLSTLKLHEVKEIWRWTFKIVYYWSRGCLSVVQDWIFLWELLNKVKGDFCFIVPVGMSWRSSRGPRGIRFWHRPHRPPHYPHRCWSRGHLANTRTYWSASTSLRDGLKCEQNCILQNWLVAGYLDYSLETVRNWEILGKIHFSTVLAVTWCHLEANTPAYNSYEPFDLQIISS